MSLLKKTYTKNEAVTWSIPNYWDLIAITLIAAIIILLAWGTKQMNAPYQLGDLIPISLDPMNLPSYALRTTMRLLIALSLSIIFTFIFGTLAAKSSFAERLIIPSIDILQSVPVLSFLSITVTGFIFIFKNSLLGPECAAIFAIFTAQVWNMTLGFYQSVKTVPIELKEAAKIFQLSAWQQFWRVEVPFAMPSLLWNMMMSLSGSWFFVVASEAICVSGQNINLPGIGSYIALAINQTNSRAIVYAIIWMLTVIFLYDQLLFRPLISWIETFKESPNEEKPPRSWLINLFQHTKFLGSATICLDKISDLWLNLSSSRSKATANPKKSKLLVLLKKFNFWLLTTVLLISLAVIWRFIFTSVSLAEAKHVMLLGVFTGARVMSLVILAALVWVPVGVWIGLRPNLASSIQPLLQFLAAFPANLLFPIVAILIINLKLNVEIWTAPLMILGTQWYILFNVIAGASTLPKELKFAMANFKVTGCLWWRRFILPGIAPYFITGAITAAGGAWNASIIAEVINWGGVKLEAQGIGAYIQTSFTAGDFPRVALGTIVMCLMVLTINRLLWRPLYNITMAKFATE